MDSSSRDGRTERGIRNREAILDAVYRMVGANELMPTAELVAENAGVGIRTVFRHFSDMDALYAEVNERVYSSVRELIDAPKPTGDIEHRAEAIIQTRFNLFERIAPFKRAGNIQRPRSKFLQAKHIETVKRLRKAVVAAFPEISAAPQPLLEAIDQTLSFEAWDRLRIDQQLSRSQAEQAMALSLMSLLATVRTK